MRDILVNFYDRSNFPMHLLKKIITQQIFLSTRNFLNHFSNLKASLEKQFQMELDVYSMASRCGLSPTWFRTSPLWIKSGGKFKTTNVSVDSESYNYLNKRSMVTMKTTTKKFEGVLVPAKRYSDAKTILCIWNNLRESSMIISK